MSVKFDKGQALGQLSLTPLIDIVFLLLIFFLVVSRFEEEERELKVKLPSASEAMPLTARPKELFINIDDQGVYFVEGAVVDDERLLEILNDRALSNPGTQSAVIRADKRCVWQPIMAAMNACNKSGVNYTVAAANE